MKKIRLTEGDIRNIVSEIIIKQYNNLRKAQVTENELDDISMELDTAVKSHFDVLKSTYYFGEPKCLSSWTLYHSLYYTLKRTEDTYKENFEELISNLDYNCGEMEIYVDITKQNKDYVTVRFMVYYTDEYDFGN